MEAVNLLGYIALSTNAQIMYVQDDTLALGGYPYTEKQTL